MTFHSRLAYWTLLVIVVECRPGLAQVADKKKETIGRAAVLAYAANVHSFSNYLCRYKYTKAQAKSVEDAIRGKFLNAVSYDSRLLVDRDWHLHEALASVRKPDRKQAVPMPGKKGMFMVPANVSSDRYLSDGKREVNFCPQLRSLGLWAKDQGEHSIEHTPLGMQFVGHHSRFGPDYFAARPDEFEFVSDGLQEIEGRPVVTVRFRYPKTADGSEPKSERAFSFDMSRGYLPIRMAMLREAKPKYQVFVTDIRECSNQRWFPERSVVVDTPAKLGAVYDVAELKLLELDADRRIGEEEFTISVPAGTQVTDQQDSKKASFRFKQDEKIRVGDLPTLFEMIKQKQIAPLMDTAVRQRSHYRWLWGIAGIGLACAGSFLYLRRFRAKSANRAPAK